MSVDASAAVVERGRPEPQPLVPVRELRDHEQPVASPRTRSEVRSALEAIATQAVSEAEMSIGRFLDAPGEVAALRVEQTLLDTMAAAATHMTAAALVAAHGDAEFVAGCKERAKESETSSGETVKRREKQMSRVRLRFASGMVLAISTVYFARVTKRSRKRRGKSGVGSYPVLEGLGIISRCTAALLSVVGKLAVTTSSFVEASELLGEHGCQIPPNLVRSVTLRLGDAAIRERESRLAAVRDGLPLTDELAGKRVVIGGDGGRIMIRAGQRRGRKRKSGRRAMKPVWREPKVLTIYVVDDGGKIDRRMRPVYEATMGDADRLFQLLAMELKTRGGARAKSISLVADGAEWIWNRVDDLADTIGVPHDRIIRVVDFYHAVEHLTAVADHCRFLKGDKRKAWLRRMRTFLKNGDIERIVREIDDLRRGRNAKAIARERDYFSVRSERMRYGVFKRKGIPIGSGAIESAVRRVVNLRCKGPSIYWSETGAERVLHLRSYAKAGRWEELAVAAITTKRRSANPCQAAA